MDYCIKLDARKECPRKTVNTIRDRRFTPYEIVYYVCLAVWILLSVIADSRLKDAFPHHGLRMVLTAVICCAYVFFEWDFSWQSCLFEVGTALFALMAFAYGYDIIGMSVCFMYCARATDFETLLRVSLYVLLSSVLLIIVLSFVGVIPDVIYTRTTSSGEIIDRHCLGFGYTTFLSHYILGVASLYVYCKHLRITALAGSFIIIMSSLVYIATDSRTSHILTVFLVVACWAFQLFRAGRKGAFNLLQKSLLGTSFAAFAAISALILLMVPYGSGMGLLMDKVLSGRMRLTQLAYDQYPLTAFGQEIIWSTTHYVDGLGFVTGYFPPGKSTEFVKAGYLFIDCSYLNLLISQGVVNLVLALAGLTAWTTWCMRHGNHVLALILFFFAIKAVIDPQLLYVNYCPFLLGIAMPLGSIGLRRKATNCAAIAFI